jgi:hypothetical protein
MPSEAVTRLIGDIPNWNRWRTQDPTLPIDLRNANLSKLELSGVDLRLADLRGAFLRGTMLEKSLLTYANLSGADLSGANLDASDCSFADFRGAYLIYASARETTMRRANLNGANLTGADLQNADLESAILLETVLVDSNLCGVKGLDGCDQPGPSMIDHRTVLRSGRLPLVFMRGCGLPDDLVESYSKIKRTLISCFLSHSTRDDIFTRKLYLSLQDAGVRCWFAPEDLPIGAKIRPAIDREIYSRDKFIIVLSKNSVESAWVEKEVETAFEREYKHVSSFLAPIRLDDAVMDTDRAWAADLRRQFNIGDFRSWEDPVQYQMAFGRLLHDLRL